MKLLRASRLTSLFLAIAVLGAALACTPRPSVDGGPAVTPTAWTDTARVVLTTLRWALPAARVVLHAILDEPARTVVDRALDAVADAAGRLGTSLDVYEARGGDRCSAHAAAGALGEALLVLTQVLGDNGIALGTTLERVVDSVFAVVDTLVPACDLDAGLRSAGDGANARLRAIYAAVRSRGVVLRHDLDDLRPLDGGQ